MIAGAVDAGFGSDRALTSTANHAMKSTGGWPPRSNATCVVPITKALAALMGQAFPVRRLQGVNHLAGEDL